MIVNLLTLIAGCVLISVGAKSWPLGIGILCVALVILNGIGNVMRQLPKPKEATKPDTRLPHPDRMLFPNVVRSARPGLN
jgi:hypothetical protein